MDLRTWEPHGTSVARQPFVADQGPYLPAIKSESSCGNINQFTAQGKKETMHQATKFTPNTQMQAFYNSLLKISKITALLPQLRMITMPKYIPAKKRKKR